MSEFPIGIFDSGIGGLALAKSITKLMPKEKIVYYGDTIHLPYGEKSKKQIQKLMLLPAREILTNFSCVPCFQN